ncbi:toxin homologue of phage lysozyme [Rosenbergiella nectarea]|uniref:Toxin homologue of phage lysozyme n=2 Tax=Rosenbergiella nectarea TaxID=988801 RepID=A0A1H9DAY0_9GAMM|nr:hypothetical protein [Rosenbergiella nectarea]SEQ09898.1 toxin homologue of phage lysozyme [Rosenbergiella nectarea]
MLGPEKGMLTFKAEGNNLKSSRDYSRIIHWPGSSLSCKKNNSGVTIGRGFDLGDRTKVEALIILKKAGIEKEKAEFIAEGAKLKGCLANNFVANQRNAINEITERQQLNLLIINYNESRKDVERICKSIFTIQKYHSKPNTSPAEAWGNIPDKIKEVLVDLRFRGDYSKRTRKYIQKLAYDGDIKGFGKVISDRKVWVEVPYDRFKRRIDFYENE